MAISEIWTLKHEGTGVEKTLADWGFSAARLTRRTQRSDTLEMRLGSGLVDDAELFAYQQAVTLKRSGAQYFCGVATKTPRMARPNAEGVSYTFEGPWWWLEALPYQQGWRALNFETLQQLSNLILNVADDGSLISTGAQITDALAQAIADGAPFQIGTIDPNIMVPPEAGRDLRDAEVVRRQLHWHPDVLTWFDYSTSPPTLHVRSRANLTAKSFSIAGRPNSGMDIAARPDLQVPVVVLKYQILNEDDGIDQNYVDVDKYPADQSEFQPGAIIMTIDLQGSRATYMKQYIKTAPIDPTSLDWWKERLPNLKDANISGLTYVADSGVAAPILADGGADSGTDPGSVQSTDDGAVYSEMIIEGEIPEWLASGHAQMVLVQARVSYDVDMGGGVTEHHDNELLLVKAMSTDLSTGWYKQLATFDPGDPEPTGLAAAYYNSLATLQYEGSFEIAEQECGTTAARYMGCKLRLTDGVDAWATMDAMIIETSEDLATGKTRLRFGPPTFLSPKDWVDLMKQNRQRQLGDRYGRLNGVLTSSSNPVGGTGKYDKAATGGKGPPQVVVPVGGNTITVQQVTLDDGLTEIPSNLTVKLRVLPICVPDGMGGTVTKSIVVVSSETFDAS